MNLPLADKAANGVAGVGLTRRPVARAGSVCAGAGQGSHSGVYLAELFVVSGATLSVRGERVRVWP
jgi:hypothetical protein